MGFKEEVEKGRIQQSPAIDQEKAQRLFKKANALDHLEKVRDFWGVGEIVIAPLALTLVHRFPMAISVLGSSKRGGYQFKGQEIDEKYLKNKYYKDEDGGYAIDVRPFSHTGIERFDPYDCLKVRTGTPGRFSKEQQNIEPCNFDLLKLIQEGLSYRIRYIDCVNPDDRASERVRQRLIDISIEDQEYSMLPLQRKEVYEADINKHRENGCLFDSAHKLRAQAFLEQTEAQKAKSASVAKKPGLLARLFPR